MSAQDAVISSPRSDRFAAVAWAVSYAHCGVTLARWLSGTLSAPESPAASLLGHGTLLIFAAAAAIALLASADAVDRQRALKQHRFSPGIPPFCRVRFLIAGTAVFPSAILTALAFTDSAAGSRWLLVLLDLAAVLAIVGSPLHARPPQLPSAPSLHVVRPEDDLEPSSETDTPPPPRALAVVGPSLASERQATIPFPREATSSRPALDDAPIAIPMFGSGSPVQSVSLSHRTPPELIGRSAPDEQETAEQETAAVDAELDEELSEVDDGIHLQLERRRNADGSEAITGLFRVSFETGQKQAALHVPFLPLMDGLPELEAMIVDSDGGTRAKVAAVYRYGARIELRRSSSEFDESLLVQLEGVVPPGRSRAA